MDRDGVRCKAILLDTSISRRRFFFNNRRLYDWPDPLKSDCQYEKFTGADIDQMTELEVWQERKRIEFLLAFSDEREILHIDFSCRPGAVITRQDWLLKRLGKLRRLRPQ